MSDASHDAPQFYRVWIVHYQDWCPNCWDEVPPKYRAVELAVGGCLSHEAAAHWLEGYNVAMLFNEAGLFDEAGLWAVAVAVQVRDDGDLCRARTCPIDIRAAEAPPALEGFDAESLSPAHFHGVSQSPQRSR